MFRNVARGSQQRNSKVQPKTRTARQQRLLMAAMESLENRQLMSASLAVANIDNPDVGALRAEVAHTSSAAPAITATTATDATNFSYSHISLSALSIVQTSASFTSANHTTFTLGSAGTFSIVTSGFTNPTITETGSLPTGVTLTDNGDGTATFAGTPAGGTTGAYTISLTAHDGIATDATQTFTLTVGTLPVFTSSDSQTFEAGSAGAVIIHATSSPGATITESGALPTGVTFHGGTNGNASITGTPAAGTGGDFVITLTADNGTDTPATQSFTLTVLEVSSITSASSANFTVGSNGSFNVTTLGFPANAIVQSGDLPSGVSFVDNGNGSGTLSGTPDTGTQGIYAITFDAGNGVDVDATQNFTLTVGVPPTVTSSNHTTVTVGTAATFSITTTGYPTAALSEMGSLPSGISFVDNGDGTATLSGTPAAATGMTYVLTLSAANGFTPDAAQTFTLTVDQAPAITSTNHTTLTVGAAGTFSVTTTGFPTNALTVTGALPSGVSFVDNGNGTATLAGTPAAATGGTYTLTISATNGVGTDASQTFTLTVDQAPVITSLDHATFTTGTAATFTVTTTGYPTEVALSETGSLPSGVTFTDNGDGTATLAGTAGAATGGTYTLSLTGSDGVAPDATQTFTLTVDQAPAITSVNNKTMTVGTAGTFTVTTTGFPTTAITETGSLPTGVTFADNGDGTATLAGTPAAASGGTYTLTVSATNGVGTDASQTFTLTVDQAPAVTSTNQATFTVGTVATFTITTSGFPTAVALSETGALPGGVSFVDNGDGTAKLSGTPAAASGGTYTLSITGTNSIGTDATQTFTLTIDQAPAVTSSNNTTFTTGVAATFTVSTTGFPTNTISKTGTLPTGVTFVDNGNGTATLAGTPGALTGKTYTLTISAANGVGSNASQVFTLTVHQAPAITSSNSQTFFAGSSGLFLFHTTGFPTAAYTETGTLPTGVTFVDQGNGSAKLSGTAGASTGGVYTITVAASNSVSPDASQTFTLTVVGPPTITNASSAKFTLGSAGTFSVTTAGYPAPSITETGALPTGVTLVDNGDGTATLAGTPAGGTQGVYTITLDAGNFIGSDALQTFTLTVGIPPSVTSANNTTFTTGAASTFSVTTSGFPTPALTKTGTLPSGVSFVDNGNGTATLAGTPAASTGGTYTLTLSAADGFSPDASQTFTLTVDQAPAVTSTNHATFTTGTAATFSVTTTGFPVAAITETGGLPTGVTFTDNGDGTATLAGTAGAASGGSYTLTIAGANGVSPDASQVFTLTVDQAPAVTSANNATFTTGAASTFSVTTTGFPTNTITETGSLPSGVTFVDNANGTATLAGTPGAATGGTYTLTVSAANGIGTDASQTFTLTVDQAPAITSGNSTTFTTSTAGTFSVTTTGFPVTAITETGSLPSGVTLTDNGDGTATLAGTPGAVTGGTYVITFDAGNTVGSDAMQTFTLTVDQAPAFSSTNNTTFTTGAASTYSITTTGFPTAVAITKTGSLPSGVTLADNGDGTATLAGTPGAATGGTYTLTLTGNDGVSPNASQTFTLTVDQAPAITSSNSTTFTTSTAGTFTVTTTGFPAAAITKAAGSLPSGVTLTDNGDGTATLAGTPGAVTGGTYVITFDAGNTIGSDAMQTFTLTVDQAPTFSSTNNTTFTTGAASTYSITTTGFPTNVAITKSGSLPSGVTLADNGDGTATLAGTPGAATGGTYTLTLTGNDGVSPNASQTFTLTVDQAPAITSGNATTFTTGTAGTFTITTTGFPVTAITETGSLPSGVTLTDNSDGTATLTGTPGAASGAAYTITLTAANTVGSDAAQTFTLTVDQAPAVTSANHATFTVGSASTFSVTTTGFPTNTITETGTLPSGVTLVDNGNNSATLAGTPAAATGGTYTITITAANTVGTNAAQVYTLTVDQAPAVTSTNHTAFAIGNASTFSVTTTGFPVTAITETGSLPSGVTLVDNGDGTASLAGTPDVGTDGMYTITLSADNSVGSAATQTFTLNVDQGSAITSANHATFTVGSASTFTVTTTGFPLNAITETGSLPSGVTLADNGDGSATLAGTPAAATGGTYTVTLTAANGSVDADQTFTLTVDQAPAVTSANHATFTVGTATTFAVTTTGFPAAAVSETGSLPSGVTLVDNGDGTASLAGTPAAATGGTFTITLTADNSIGSAANQTFTLTVDQAVAVTSTNSTQFIVSTADTYTVTTTGFPLAAITETGSLPGGVTFTDNGDGTGTLAGTPGAGQSGNYTITFGASNVVNSVNQTFTLTVGNTSAITSANAATFTVGTVGTFTVTASGFPAATFAEVGTLPTGLSFDTSSGALTGTPAAATGGTYTLTFSATNSFGTSANQTFTLTVDQAAAITSSSSDTFTVGTAGTFSVTTTGFPLAALTETGSLPTGVTLNDNGDGTATLAGTPAAGTGGTFAVTLTANNGVGALVNQTFTLTVNQAPAITSANHVTFVKGSAGTFTVLTTGFPTNSFNETGTLPTGVTLLDNGDGTAQLAGTPSGSASGTYTLTISASNGIGTDASQVFTLTINVAPAITSGNSTALVVGTPSTFALTTTGFPTAAITESGALPTGIIFTDNGDGSGSLAGTPAAATTGTYTLTITASNGVGSNASQTFTMTVNQIPAITSSNHATFTTGAAGTFTVVATGVPTVALTEVGSLPTGVTFADNGDGTATVVGTPGALTGGTYILTLTATNGIGTAASQTFTLTVDDAPAITNANHDMFIVGAAQTFAVTTTGFPVTAITETGTLPTGVTFTDNGDGTASLAGSAASGTGGTYTLTLSAANGVGTDATQTFTLTVNQIATFTSANNTSFAVGTAGTFTVTTVSFPADTLSETGTLPSGVTFHDNGDGTATIAGTPAAATGGAYVLTLTGANGTTADGTQTFTLNVTQTLAITSTNHTTFTTGTAGTFAIATTGFPTPALTETGVLPTGVTFVDNGDGTATLAGTPGAVAGGIYTLTIDASNGVATDVMQTFTLNVGQAPAITSANHATFDLGAAETFSITATAFPTAAITESGTLPSGITFTPTGPGAATLTGTAAAGTDGTYTITLTAKNGSVDAAQTFTLTVGEPAVITSPDNATFFTAGTPGPVLFSTQDDFSQWGSNGNSSVSTANQSTPDFDHNVFNGLANPSAAGAVATIGAGSLSVDLISGGYDFAYGPGEQDNAAFLAALGSSGTLIIDYSLPANMGGNYFNVGVVLNYQNNFGQFMGGTPVDNGNGTLSISIPYTVNTLPSYSYFQLGLIASTNFDSNGATAFTVDDIRLTQQPGAGTFTVTATGTPAPTFTETGTLPTGVTFDTSTGVLTGTPDAGTGGTYDLLFTAHNGIDADATQDFVLTVDDLPAITSTTSATFTVGTSGTFAVTTTGFPAPAFSETGALPSGVSFDSTTGLLTGTPAAGTGGAYVLTLTAANSVGPNVSQVFTLSVDQAPAITSTGSATFKVGSAGTFNVVASGFPAATFSETGALPGGVTLISSTGALIGTPAAGSAGIYTLTITATNGVGTDSTQTFTLTVDQVPAFTSANTTSFTAGLANTFIITTTGFPTAAFTKTGTLPSGVTFTDGGDGTATISGTSTAVGTYHITLTANNGVSPNAVQTFSFIVHSSAASKISSLNHATFKVGTAGTFRITTTGFPVGALTETGTLPNGVTFTDNSDGTASLFGTATSGTGGTYTLTLSASNGVGVASSQVFTLSVDEAPAITSANNVTFTTGTAGTFTLTSTGFPNALFTKTGVGPAGIILVNKTDGTARLEGTPTALAGGTYHLTFTAANGTTPNATQVFTITVNQAPKITSLTVATFTVGTAGSFTVHTTGFPAAAITETGSLPSGVTLTDNGNGTATLSGTPDVSTGGIYTITLNADNSIGTSANQTFKLTVRQAPAITSANNTTVTTGTAGTFTVTATGFPSVTLARLAGTLPVGLTFVNKGNGTATITGKPAAASGGVYHLTIEAINGVIPVATQVFTTTVDQAPAITSLTSAIFNVGKASTFTIKTTGFPVNAITSSGTLPTGVTLTDNGNGTATLAGTPAAATGGLYPLSLTASNGIGSDANQTFNLTVRQPLAITSVNNTTFTTNTSGSFTIQTTGFPVGSILKTGVLPAGLTFTDNLDGTATISGTAISSAVSVITLTATNHNLTTSATQRLTITVSAGVSGGNGGGTCDGTM